MSRRRAPLLVAAAVLTLAAGCARAPDLEVARRVQAAQETFQSARSPEDYLRAAAIYQEVLASGFESGAVLYNQGNAFMQAGRRAPAIAAYRRAQRHRPRDPYLEANLAFARAGLPVQESRRPLAEVLLFWHPWLSAREKFQATLAAALATALLALAAQHAARRKPWARGAAAGVFLTLLLALSAAYDGHVSRPGVRGVVSADGTIARKGDGEAFEPALTEPLREGMECTVEEERPGWIRVRLPGGAEGWVARNEVVLY